MHGSIAVAMSGGVDSSVAAALLRDAGQDVFGLTALMSPDFSRCCSDEDIETARQVARQLGIPHEVVDVSDAFQESVIDYFSAEYIGGRTPSPCVVCNRTIKFGRLLDEAVARGATALATGHYTRINTDTAGRAHLLRGRDAVKDQSYFLARMTALQLAQSRFPLGEMLKVDVQRIAREKGLAARASKESQELCFIREGGHGEWIDVRCLNAGGPGDIVNTSGEIVGPHRGLHHYTVGQRKGLGFAAGKPMYVVALDAGTNRVIVGERAEALSDTMAVRDINWIGGACPPSSLTCLVQIRYNHAPAPAHVEVCPRGSARVRFAEPQFAVAPGQLAAFYRGDEVLGGGWIEREIE